jgi:hypothetical protein
LVCFPDGLIGIGGPHQRFVHRYPHGCRVPERGGGDSNQDFLPDLDERLSEYKFQVMSATVVIHLIIDRSDRRGAPERGDRIDCRCRWIFPIVYFKSFSAILAIAFIEFLSSPIQW